MELNQNEIQQEGTVGESQEKKLDKGKLALILVIGFLIGVSFKAQAVRTITMGFEDYKLKSLRDDFVRDKKEKKPAANEENSGSDQPSQENQGSPVNVQPEGNN